jgi:2-dehydropantoate 2-reductase
MASVAVIGPGSIGAALAAALHLRGHAVALIARQVRDHITVKVDGGFEPSTIVVPGIEVRDPIDLSRFDAVVLATKTTQVQAAAPLIRAAHRGELPVFIVQNGVDHRERLEAVVGDDPQGLLVPVVVYLAGHRTADGVVHVGGPGRLVLPVGPHSERLGEWLDPRLIEVRITRDFTTHAWRKLLINASTGVFGVLSGRGLGVVDDPEARQLVTALMAEAAQVGRAEGAELAPDIAEQLTALVVASTGDHLPSIAQDRRDGLPSEWRERNEVVVRLAERHGIEVPLNRLATALIRLGEPPA